MKHIHGHGMECSKNVEVFVEMRKYLVRKRLRRTHPQSFVLFFSLTNSLILSLNILCMNNMKRVALLLNKLI